MSPILFFNLMKVVSAYYAMYIQITDEDAPTPPPTTVKITIAEINKMVMLLLTDLFGMSPVIKTELARGRAIGQLQMMYPDCFGQFLTKRIDNLQQGGPL